MKRILIIIAVLIPFMGMAQSSPVDKLFEKYANKDGITTVRISGALLKFASKLDDSNTPESQLLSGLDGIRILAVEDSLLNRQVNFYKELEQEGFFKNNKYEVLMEVTESSEIVRFYGRMLDNGSLSELLLVVGGDDNALISIQGLINPDNIAKITNALDIDVVPDIDED